MSIRLFSSESVTEGHPDKVCDQISDAILDALLAVDPSSRVAVETVVTRGLVHVVGEVTTETYVEIPALVRQTLTRIGYGNHQFGFDGANCGVSVSLGAQSPDIAAGVFNETEQGAGDQGIMFGYASNETQSFMPLPIWLAHRLAERLAEVRKSGQLPYLGPDGKTQVTIGYEGNTPRTIDAVVVSAQHLADIDLDTLRAEVASHVIDPVLRTIDIEQSAPRLFINHMGKFVEGGPGADAGLTGRKIIVDTYGGSSRHGGGAFSGKDPSKVDRSGAYALRWAAKNAVAAGLADRIELQIAYAIGVSQPVGVYVETFGTHHVDPEKIESAIREVFDFRPAAIIRDLDLLKPRYAETASYGHFGREGAGFTWENLDRVEDLRSAVGL